MSQTILPPVATLCSSFSEWNDRCVEFVEGRNNASDDEEWISVICRLDRWAHAASNSTSKNNQKQKQQMPIVSPLSRTSPPKWSFETLNEYDNNDDESNGYFDSMKSRMAIANAVKESLASAAASASSKKKDSTQQKNEEENDNNDDGDSNNNIVEDNVDELGILLQPLIWCLFCRRSKTNNNNKNENEATTIRLIYVATAPAHLAVVGESIFEISQWHTQQLFRLLDHTPLGRYPKKICVSSCLNSPATNKKNDEKNDVDDDKNDDDDDNDRCSKFTLQSLNLVLKQEREQQQQFKEVSGIISVEEETDSILFNNNNNENHPQTLLLKLLESNNSTIPSNIIPPDQSDPNFISKPNFNNNFEKNKVFLLPFKFRKKAIVVRCCSSSTQQHQYALLVPFGCKKSNLMSLLKLSFLNNNENNIVSYYQSNREFKKKFSVLSSSSSPSSSFSLDQLVISIRFFKDVGDALAAAKLLNDSDSNSSNNNTNSSIANKNIISNNNNDDDNNIDISAWNEMLVPTVDSGGELVLEFWKGMGKNSQMMLSEEDLKFVSSSSNETSFLQIHGFVQQPVIENENINSSENNNNNKKNYRLPGESSSVLMGRRSVSDSEFSETIEPFLKQLLSTTKSEQQNSDVVVEVDLEKIEMIENIRSEIKNNNNNASLTTTYSSCSWCGRTRETNKKCGNCLCVSYCSRSHQLLHYKGEGGHKKDCKKLKKAAEEIKEIKETSLYSRTEEKEEEISPIDAIVFAIEDAVIKSKFTGSRNEILIYLPFKMIPSLDFLKQVAENCVVSLANLNNNSNKNNNNKLFVTICCGEAPPATKNEEENFLGIVESSEQEEENENQFRWIPPSKTLSDPWYEKSEFPSKIFSSSSSSATSSSSSSSICVCRIHRFATIPQIITEIGLKPKQLQQNNTDNTDNDSSSPLVIVFSQGHSGIAFFDRVSRECANVLQKFSSNNNNNNSATIAILADSKFAAENSVAAILEHSKQGFQNNLFSPLILLRNENQEHQTSSTTRRRIQIVEPSMDSKLLLPRVVHGFLALI